jgi:hypothetical protein
MFNLSNLKINFSAVEKVFIDCVLEQADQRQVSHSEVALRIFPQELPEVAGEYGIKVRVSSLTESFQDEIVKLKDLTFYDQGNHISQAFMKIFENEVKSHNSCLLNKVISTTTLSYKGQIAFDKLELFVQTKNVAGQVELDMNIVYDFNKLREYSIREEFSDAEEHLKEMKNGESI